MKRKMNKHLARLCLCLMLVYLLVPALSMPAYADEMEDYYRSIGWNKEYETATVSTSSSSYTEGDPCWVLQDVRTISNEKEYREYGNTLTYKEYGNLQAHTERPWITMDVTFHASPLPNSLHPGDTLTINYDFDIQADISDITNETFSISGQIMRYSMLEDFEPQEFWDKKEALEMIEYWYFMSDGTSPYDIQVGIGDASEGDQALHNHGADIIKDGSYLNTTYPVGQPGELLLVCVNYYHVGYLFSLVQEKYLYAWEGSTTQNVIVEAGNGPGETGEEIDSGVINPGSNHGGSGDDSGWTGGDDGGDDDGNALGTLAKVGGGAAAAGIGIKVIKGLAGKSGKSGGGGGKKKKKKKRTEDSGDDPRDDQKDDQKDEDEKKRYEMRVYKEFGDTIYAGKTVTLSARIVEISASGVERTVPELTQQITISSSNYLQVGGTFLSGQYQSARVTAPEYDEAVPSTAVVTFRLMAPGGSFTQHMRFNIKKADPAVVWLDPPVNVWNARIEIIAGDNATYRLRFFFHDVSEEPEKIVFDQYSNYDITVEPADTMYTYWILVKNRTAPMDNKIIYEDYFSDTVTFTAIFKDGLEMKESFSISRYPEGLSVIADLEDGRIPVKAYKKEYYGDLDSPYPMSGLRYSCAHRTENGVEVFQPYEEDLRYGSLQGDRGEKDNNVAMKYPYRADVWGFMPLKTLNEPSPGATYLMKIDVVWKEKPDDVLTLPLTFHLKPKDPMEEWNEEYKKLQQRVINFSVPETIEVNLAKIKRITPQNTSQYELRLFNKAILKDYIAYWESEAKYEIDLANYLADLENGASWLAFLGDCAFTYIIYYYSTLHGYPAAAPYLDAILSPSKDLFEQFAGRCTWAYIDSNSIDWDGFLKMVTDGGKSALDDVLFEMIPDDAKDFFKVKPVKLKKVGLMISCYIMVDFCMNLTKNRIDLDDSEERKKQLQMSDEEFEEATSWTNSIYTALLDTFKDMSLKFITSIVGKNIEKYLEKPNVREKLGKWVSGTLNVWWKGEKATREGLKGAKQAYFALERRKKANTLKKLSKELSQQPLDISTSNIDNALEELKKFTSTLKKINNTTEELQKLQSKSIKIFNDDMDKIAKRSELFSDLKKKVQEAILGLPEKEIANLLFSKNWFFTRKGGGWWGDSFGMLFDKLVSKGAGKVYDLTTGAMIDQINGLEEDRNAQAEAEQAAAEMEAQVETKKLLAQLLLDVEKAETPEEVARLVDRFQKELEPPQEEQDDDDYAFDSDPEFKTGEDGCTYVVLKFRKSGTNEGYRFEYNLSKMLRNLVDSKLGIEFVKSLFGGSVPELPEGKLPMPSDPPLASDLR